MVPSRALVKVAGMLKPEGVAFVEYDAWTDKPAKSSTGESERIVRAFNRFWDGREKVFSIDSSKSSERDKGRDLYWAVIERKR